ncbi:MAG: sugar phosphate nucleotidyltransferase [Candidatus Micrarchaeota archaeon]
MVERITITINDKLLKKIDSTVGSNSIRNRSQAISLLLEKSLGKTQEMSALILCGKPENALKKEGGLTTLEKILNYLKKNNFTRVILALSTNSQKIIDLLKNFHGIKIEYVWDEGKGTALALEKAQGLLKETFLLSYADVSYEELDLNDFKDFHNKNKGACTIALAEAKKPLELGVAKLMGSKVIDFEEKPTATDTNLVNAGVALCEPQVFNYINSKTTSFEKNLLPLLAKQGKLMGYNYSGEWKHYG